jgi:FdhD protein
MQPNSLPAPTDFAAAVRARATTLPFDGGVRSGDRPVAIETPVNIVYGTVPYAVMMTTPADLEDFAVGFSLTEGVIRAEGDIRGVRIEEEADGLRLHVDLAPEPLHGFFARRRAMSGRTGCGVCGIEDLAALPRAGGRPVGPARVDLDAIRHALGALADHQILNEATRAMHAAAWCGLDGTILCVREDVGRHNALDKAVGALARGGIDPAEGFLLITSRCSYEMVEKAAAFGAAVLVAISAPTSLAIERAEGHGMTLVAIARADAVTVFAGAERLASEARVAA